MEWRWIKTIPKKVNNILKYQPNQSEIVYGEFKCAQPLSINWPEFKSIKESKMKRKKQKKNIETWNKPISTHSHIGKKRTHTHTYTPLHTPINFSQADNSKDDDGRRRQQQYPSAVTEKKAFRSELIGQITANWVCFSCSCRCSTVCVCFFFVSKSFPPLARINFFAHLSSVCVCRATCASVTEQRKKHLLLCTILVFFSLSVFSVCLFPIIFLLLSFSAFVLALRVTLFRSGFDSIGFLFLYILPR